MSVSARLRLERKAISEQMRSLLTSTSPNAAEQWRKLDGVQEELRLKIAAIELDSIERDLSNNSTNNNTRSLDRPNIGTEFEANEATPLSRGQQIRSGHQYKSEFDHWLRTGERGMELRAVGISGNGATLVPIGFEMELEKKLKYFGGLYNICRVLATDTGNPLHYPTMDDTGNTGEWLAEAAGVGSADPTFSEIVLNAYLLSSKQVKVSVQAEQDSAFNLGSVLSDAFGERLGRSLDTALWTGDGSTVPVTGLLTALQAAGGRSVLAVGANANDGVSNSLNSVGTDDFSALIDKLDRAYQRDTNQFVFNQTTMNSLRKMKDKYGRPVWEVSLAQGNPDTIFGYGFTIDNAFANIGAGNVSVAFGDPSKYVIRRALGFTLVRLSELYMANYQVAFQAFMRIDAKLLQSAAWSYLTHPLS